MTKQWNFKNSVSSRQFREFRDFSAIAENHWPYSGSVATTVGSVALVSESDSPRLKLAVSLALAEYRPFTAWYNSFSDLDYLPLVLYFAPFLVYCCVFILRTQCLYSFPYRLGDMEKTPLVSIVWEMVFFILISSNTIRLYLPSGKTNLYKY